MNFSCIDCGAIATREVEDPIDDDRHPVCVWCANGYTAAGYTTHLAGVAQ